MEMLVLSFMFGVVAVLGPLLMWLGYKNRNDEDNKERMTAEDAIKIISDECKHIKHHLTEKGKAPEFYQELGDMCIAFYMGVDALDKICQIEKIIDTQNSVIQEDALKYQMIREVLK